MKAIKDSEEMALIIMPEGDQRKKRLDIFEKICHKGLAAILLHYIDSKLLTLDTINCRKQNFHYGQIENGNRSPVIKRQGGGTRKIYAKNLFFLFLFINLLRK
jgi:hypothetical protein